MATTSIHHAIHGYRDGHRLLSSSLPLNSDASRAMLVLSDMSGPSMYPGFEEYLTGYPLPGGEIFVFAKTWYASEMQRPGCVWTHSLLILRDQVSKVSSASLLASLRRPQIEGVESAATVPLVLDPDVPVESMPDSFADKPIAAALFGAVLGQTRPVIVVVDSANHLEPLFLRLWDELWPAAKALFSFCTGALLPRVVCGTPMDLQAVPRAIPPSQFRKNAGAALVIDQQAPGTPDGWVELVLRGASHGNASFRSWMEAAIGPNAGRGAVPGLLSIYGQWDAADWSPCSVLASIASAPDLEFATRARLLNMVFARSEANEGAARRRELLETLCGQHDADLSSIIPLLEGQTRQLFQESRAEGCALTFSLLGAELTGVGERVLRTAFLSLMPCDLERLDDAQTSFLPTIASANPSLASAPGLWKRAGHCGPEILAQLDASNLGEEERIAVVDAVLASGRDVPVEALIRFAGDSAVRSILTAIAGGALPFSTQWRQALAGRSDAVVAWLEGQATLSSKELEIASRFVGPTTNVERLVKVWRTGIGASAASPTPRVAAFGLALAFSECLLSPLIATCFEPTFHALAGSRLEYEEWEWLCELAPAVAWWRDWDKCERIAAALARRLERHGAPLETIFSILRGREAIRKVAAALDDNRNTRPYFKSLLRAAKACPSLGTREQREALSGGW